MRRFKKTVLGVVTGAMMFALAACSAFDDMGDNAATDNTNGNVNSVTDGRSDTGDDNSLSEDVGDVADDVKDGVEDAGRDVKDGAKDIGREMKDGIDDLDGNR